MPARSTDELQAELDQLTQRLLLLFVADGFLAHLRWIFRSPALKRRMREVSDELKRRTPDLT